MVSVHVGLAVLVGLRIAFGPYGNLAGQPSALFRPVWFLEPLPGMPPEAAIFGLQVVGVAAAVLAVAADGRRRREAFAVAWICLMVLAGLRGSLGKVLHNDVLLVLACVPFLAAPVSRDGDRRLYGWPVRTAMVVVAAAYFFSGLAKLRTAGLEWITSDNLRFVFTVAGRSGRPAYPGIAEFIARQDLLLHVVAAVTLALELAFPLILVWRRSRPVFIAGAAALHAGTWLTLGIDYWTWIGVAAVVLVDWDGVIDAAGRRRRSDPAGPLPAGGPLPVPPASAGTLGGPVPS
jgi:hypothetical protein